MSKTCKITIKVIKLNCLYRLSRDHFKKKETKLNQQYEAHQSSCKLHFYNHFPLMQFYHTRVQL